ncbi:MAG: hypothetical protein AB8G96_01760 [Phycisphaerales bacterium]
MPSLRLTSTPALLNLLLATLALVASGAVTSAAVAADRYIALTTDVDVRSGPGASYYPTARLKAGEILQVADEKRGWLGVYVDAPGLADRYGLIRLRPTELDALTIDSRRQREAGRSFKRASVQAPLFIVAPNIDANDDPSASWRHIHRLRRGDGIRIIGEPTRIGPNQWHRVHLPAGTIVWIEDSAVREASTVEAASLTRFRNDPTGAIAAEEARQQAAAEAARLAAAADATPPAGAVARPETALTGGEIPALRPPADPGGTIEMGGNRSTGSSTANGTPAGTNPERPALGNGGTTTNDGGRTLGDRVRDVRRPFGDAMRDMQDEATDAADAVTDAVTNSSEGAADAVDAATETAGSTGTGIVDAADAVGETLLNGGSRAAESARDLISEAGRDPLNERPALDQANRVAGNDSSATDRTDVLDPASRTTTGNDVATETGTARGTTTGTDAGQPGTTADPAATGTNAPAGASTQPDPSGSDAAAALPPAERLDALEMRFEVLRRGDVALAEVGPLRRLFEAYRDDVAGEHPDKARYAEARIAQLRIWGELQVERERIAALRRDLNQASVVVADAAKRITREAGFTAVGRLSASRIFDGATLPRFLRLEAIDSNRTIAYLRTDADARLDARVGQIVGVSGRKTWDPGLQLDLIDVTEVRDLQMDESGGITVRANPGGTVDR